VAVLQELARELNSARAAGRADAAAALGAHLRRLADVLAILQVDPEVWFRLQAGDFRASSDGGPQLDEAQIELRIGARLEARRTRDFAAADRIRAELAQAGVQLEDQPGGRTIWRRE